MDSMHGFGGGQPPSTSTPAPPAGIFLSYRRGDPGARVGRLYDRLVSRFGKERVFRDIDSALPAANFELVIDQALSASRVLIAVIGPTWQTVTNSRGERRLDDPKDYVRYEIARALANDECHVLPVLRGAGTMMPAADDLPEELRPLVTLQAIRVDEDDEGPHFEFDAQQVVNAVARILGAPESRLDPDIVLSPPDLVLDPGQSGQIAVVARNVPAGATDVSLSYEGPAWAGLDLHREPAAGGHELHTALIARPPHRPDLPPRSWPYAVELREQAGSRPMARATGTLITVAYRDTQVRLAPSRVETRRAAQLSLTVANHGNVPLQGRVLTKAGGMTSAGPDRISLAPGTEETYPVTVGARGRRLLGRTIEQPVTVSLAVQGEPRPHVRQALVRQRPLLSATGVVLAAMLAATLVGLGVWRALDATATRVPDVVGLPQAEAVEKLTDAGIDPSDIDLRPVDPADPAGGLVVRIEPGPGEKVPPGDSVDLYVDNEPTTTLLPDITPMTREDAERTLAEAGFTAVEVALEPTDEEDPGQVLRTIPGPGTDVALTAAVTIYVAEQPSGGGGGGGGGGTHVEIPPVAHLTYPEAAAVLDDHFDPVEEAEPSADVPSGLVIRTDPPAGESHPEGTTVTVLVSSGPGTVEVPDVRGLDASSAQATLEQLGLTVSIGTEDTCDVPAGTVVSQSPGAGTDVDQGANVEIRTAEPPPAGCA